jgi:hypothetical protein
MSAQIKALAHPSPEITGFRPRPPLTSLTGPQNEPPALDDGGSHPLRMGPRVGERHEVATDTRQRRASGWGMPSIPSPPELCVTGR